MDLEELHRRLPEIKNISDDTIRHEVEKIFLTWCPDYFWEKPASSSGNHHQVDHRGKHGLWIHTRRAAVAFERLSKSYLHQNLINEQMRDCGRAAILVHDIFKYGKPEAGNSHTTKDHDKMAATFLRNKSKLPPTAIGCIESHNGAWYKGKSPETPIEQVHHLADMIASDESAYFKVEDPHRKIEEMMVDIEEP